MYHAHSRTLVIPVCFLIFLSVLTGCASKPAAPAASSADITRTMGQLNVAYGASVKLPLDGRLVQIGNAGLPPVFGPDTLVFNVTHQYWLDGGKQAFGNYQLILSGVQPIPALQSVSGSTVIEKGTVIGTATESPVQVNLRCRTIDLFLCDSAQNIPELVNGWYYFGVGMLMSGSPKFLNYQPVTSAKDEIPFWDFPESLEQMSQRGRSEYEAKAKGEVVSRYPDFQICFETTLDRYPSTDLRLSTNVSPAERLMLARTYSNCPYYLSVDFDGVPMQLFFQDGFDQYLKDEYTLGDPIWLYLQVSEFINGELIGYVRDFTLKSPVETVLERQERLLAAMDELDSAE